MSHQSIFGLTAFALMVCFAQLSLAQAPGNKEKAKKLERERAREAAGSVEGAIWDFKLTPRFPAQAAAKGKENVTGRYRIADLKIFQAETPDGKMDKEVGISKPNSQKSTIVEFEKLMGRNKSQKQIELKGNATLTIQKAGFWEGEFVDGDGFKWILNVRRIQE